MTYRIALLLFLGCCSGEAAVPPSSGGGKFSEPIPPATPTSAAPKKAQALFDARPMLNGITRIIDNELDVVCYYKQAEHREEGDRNQTNNVAFGYGYAALSCLPIPPR